MRRTAICLPSAIHRKTRPIGGMPTRCMTRYMIAATAFGLVFPVLNLRVPKGPDYSCILHWICYAVTVAMPAC